MKILKVNSHRLEFKWFHIPMLEAKFVHSVFKIRTVANFKAELYKLPRVLYDNNPKSVGVQGKRILLAPSTHYA